MSTGLRLEKCLRPSAVAREVLTEDELPSSWLPATAEAMDQGCCGSCYAVAITQVLQDRWNTENPDQALDNLSHLDLLATEVFPGVFGKCSGGFIGGDRVEAFMLLRGVGVTTWDHPCRKECTLPQGCRPPPASQHLVCPEWSETTSSRVMQQRLHADGPLVAGFGCPPGFAAFGGASWRQLQQPLATGGRTFTHAFFPTAGDMRDWAADPQYHAVALVGWVTVNSSLLWVVRNSWGRGWGDDGYCLVASNRAHPREATWDSARADSDWWLPLASGPVGKVELKSGELARRHGSAVRRAADELREQLPPTALDPSASDMPMLVAGAVAVLLVLLAVSLLKAGP